MSYTITNDCISCERCLSACPTQAIQKAETTFWIESSLCNHCQDYYGVPQCWSVCPTNEGCVPLTTGMVMVDTKTTEDYWESWFSTYTTLVERLKGSKQSQYWQQWFDHYSQIFKNLQARVAEQDC